LEEASTFKNPFKRKRAKPNFLTSGFAQAQLMRTQLLSAPSPTKTPTRGAWWSPWRPKQQVKQTHFARRRAEAILSPQGVTLPLKRYRPWAIPSRRQHRKSSRTADVTITSFKSHEGRLRKRKERLNSSHTS